jgi:hypothetical protein
MPPQNATKVIAARNSEPCYDTSIAKIPKTSNTLYCKKTTPKTILPHWLGDVRKKVFFTLMERIRIDNID